MQCIFYVEVHWVAFLLILPHFIDLFISLLLGIHQALLQIWDGQRLAAEEQ